MKTCRQVRRTVGVLLGLAQHRITLEDVRTMLEVPSANSWPKRIKTMPPQGLYLSKVNYRDEDLLLPLDYIQKHT